MINDFIDIQTSIDDVIDKFKDFGNKHSFTCECPKHGLSEAFLNNTCVKCKQDTDILSQKEAEEKKIADYKMQIGCTRAFINATFDNFIANTKSKQVLFKDLQNYNFDKNILWNGDCGNGKTHLAWALIDKAIRRDKYPYYVKYYQIFKIKCDKWSQYEKMLNSDFLVIDEMGMTATDNKNQEIFEILEYRYNVNPTMLISNLEYDVFKSMFSVSTFSRLQENLLHLMTKWSDYRIKHK